MINESEFVCVVCVLRAVGCVFNLIQSPRYQTYNHFENQFGNDLNLFLKNVSIHAGTGENVGSVGKKTSTYMLIFVEEIN